MSCATGRSGIQRGSTLVEFSLSAFLLFMTVFSVTEFSRLLLVYTTLANAARAGARYAIVHGGDRTGTGVDGPSGPGSVSQIQTVVRNFASTGAMSVNSVTVNVNYIDGNNAVGSRVEVQAVYAYDPFISWFTQLSGLSLQSTSRGVITF